MIIDTNALLRLIIGDVPEQTEKVELVMDQASRGELVVVDAVFVEMCFVMEFSPQYRFDRAYIYRALNRICDIAVFSVSPTVRLAIEQYGADSKLDFVDCLLIAEAKERSADILTFDKHLLKVTSKD